MKAIVYDSYGSLDGLGLRDVEVPEIADDQVLVRVRAAAVHVGDLICVRGAPVLVRLDTGLFRPKRGVPGYDLAGEVEAVGGRVAGWHPGDAVFGVGNGTCAEYASAKEDDLAPKPAGLSFEEAAALPTSGIAALQGLRDAASVASGQRVLVNGASGGVGTFAVQLAKAMGANVTGVAGTRNVELVRSLGADRVIDYTREDFTQEGVSYDVIFDNVENRTLADVRRALTSDGTLLCNSGTGASGFAFYARLLHPLLLSPFVRQDLKRFLSMPNEADLLVLKEHVEAGRLRPVLDRTWPLAETAAALRHVETGHARGKVVVTP